jgi:hypothetical protein
MTPNNKEAYDSFDKHAYLPSNYPEFNPFIYSLEQSFPLANLGMRDHWEPNPVGSVVAPALSVGGSGSKHWRVGCLRRGSSPV